MEDLLIKYIQYRQEQLLKHFSVVAVMKNMKKRKTYPAEFVNKLMFDGVEMHGNSKTIGDAVYRLYVEWKKTGEIVNLMSKNSVVAVRQQKT